MKVRYEKMQTMENEKGKQLKFSFSGSLNLMEVNFVVSGDEEDILSFMTQHNLKKFGQQLDIDVVNKQTTL